MTDRARRRALAAGLATLGLPLAAAAQPQATASGAGPAPGPGVRAAAASAPVFVLNSQDATVSQIDRASWSETRRIAVGKEPHHLYLTPDEKNLIVANAAGNSLSFIDPATGALQRTVRDIVDPYHLRFSPDMAWFVTAANRLDHVDLYRWQPQDAERPFKLLKRIAAPRTPSHLFIDSRSSVAYVSLQDSDELLALDLATQSVRWKVKTGKMPADVFLTRDDRTLLLGLTGDRFVEAWDVSAAGSPRRVRRIETGDGAHAFRARGDGRQVFVSNRVANTISLIDTTSLSVLRQLPGPGGPDCMEMLSDGRTLLLSSRWARKLSIIDVEQAQVLRQVAVGRSPHGVWTLDHAPRV